MPTVIAGRGRQSPAEPLASLGRYH